MTVPARVKGLDLFAVAAFGVLTLLFVVLGPVPAPLRLAVSLPVMLFGVGYALAAAAFPTGSLQFAQRIVLSIALSISTLVLAGVVLNLFDSGITPHGWAAATAIVATAAAVAGGVRRAPGHAESERPDFRLPRPGTLAVAAAALLLVVVAIQIGDRDYRTHERRQGVTGLWTYRPDAAHPDIVRVGFERLGPSEQRYRVELRVGGRTIHAIPSVVIPAGGSREFTLRLPRAARTRGADAFLYTGSGRTPFRHAILAPEGAP